MIPINNSDTAWLIVSDYNQDNGKYYNELREDVYNPEVNEWDWEFTYINVGGGISNVNEHLHCASLVGDQIDGAGLGGVGDGCGGGYYVGGNDHDKA